MESRGVRGNRDVCRRRLEATIAAFLLTSGAAGISAARAQETARSADAFVDRIGVCTHWGRQGTPYGDEYPRLRDLMGDSGIRFMRDAFSPAEADLYKKYGIKTMVIVNPPDIAEAVKTIQANVAQIDRVEGPDEVDVNVTNAAYGTEGFPQGPRRFQKDLFDALKAKPETAGIGVVGPTVRRPESNRQFALLEGIDFQAVESFPGADIPSLLTDAGGLAAQQGASGKPVVAAAVGYHTALNAPANALGGAQPGVTERAQAKYLLRQFANDFQAGIDRTFAYELIDEAADYKASEREGTNPDACYGLIRNDFTPKPAYVALKSLIALLSERSWNPRKKAFWWEPVGDTPRGVAVPFRTPTALDFTLTGANAASVRHVLLQKQTGDFYLLLWQEVPSFDPAAKTDLTVAPAPITLTLKTPFRGGAVYDPLSGSADPTQIFGPTPGDITIAVPDSVVVVQITPTTPWPTSPNAAPAP